MITTSKDRPKARVGTFAVGHETYWCQFEGLLESLIGHHRVFTTMLETHDVEVIDYGMVDSSTRAYDVLQDMKKDNLDLLFCNMVTYATSSTFAPISRDIGIPIVLVALQPLAAMDYSQANTFMQLENDNICSVPEFVGVAFRLGRKVADVIIGTLYEDDCAKASIHEWCNIAKVLRGLKGARIGLMGHVLESMYDMHTDPTAMSAAFGIHAPLLEVDDIIHEYNLVTSDDIAAQEEEIRQRFDMPEPKSDPVTQRLTPEDLHQSAKVSVALDRLIQHKNLTGLAYYYQGLHGSLHWLISSSLTVGSSLLIGQGVPVCGEYDIKTCIAMLMMDRLGIGGSFAEFHPFDFLEDFILIGHDGPHHIAIAEDKPILRSLRKYHGKQGHGASVEFKIKEGPITMLGITQNYDGRFRLIIGEGYSKKGPIPPTGNTNTRGFFEPNTKDFVKAWVMEGPTHHYALGVGHHGKTLKKIGEIIGIESVIVKA